MGTCLIDFVLQKSKLGIKNILSFCDNCPGQNRNRPIAAAMVYTVMNSSTEVFFMCFLEKVHTENPADEIHSLIERENNDSVYSPRDWVVLMRQIKTKNVSINAKLLDHSRFFDVEGYAQQFSNFHKDENGTPILNWKTVRILMARKSDSYILFFKNEYNQPEFQQINLLQRGDKRKTVLDKNSIITNLKSLYSSKLPISTDKYNDLMKLCELCIIPDDYHEDYKQLPQRNKK